LISRLSLDSASKNGEKNGVHPKTGERSDGIGESAALLNQQRAHHEAENGERKRVEHYCTQ
jgi:hypothetical protein